VFLHFLRLGPEKPPAMMSAPTTMVLDAGGASASQNRRWRRPARAPLHIRLRMRVSPPAVTNAAAGNQSGIGGKSHRGRSRSASTGEVIDRTTVVFAAISVFFELRIRLNRMPSFRGDPARRSAIAGRIERRSSLFRERALSTRPAPAPHHHRFRGNRVAN